MPLDFSKMKAPQKTARPIDPIELFQKLKVVDQNINDLWLAQGDALREWHKNRNKSDVAVVLNTGAGKTLVGLLIAQSLVNETQGHVVYVCSSIQLIEQTAEKADGYGLDVTTYYRGSYNNDLFSLGKAPCITTYQALFNGKSIFFHQDCAAIVFDDAHTADNLLRDHFSLRLDRASFPAAYAEILALFRNYHHTVGMASSYNELKDNSNGLRILLIPPFEVQKQFGELVRILTSERLHENENTTFTWEFLRDRIDLCCVLMTASAITFTPPFVPVRDLPYFRPAVRRVYLSATLSAPDAFVRTFGRVPDSIIAPTTTAGECERLILIPARTLSASNDLDATQELISNRKALILVPSYSRAGKWSGIASIPPREAVSKKLAEFKSDTEASKLILAARYDGMDLPGDTCRLMILDELPMGVGPLERYLWEYLNLINTLRTAVASRIVQSFGRISRGMSDHGVVILTGKQLIEWILRPANARSIPKFLQKQIQLGYEISMEMESLEDLGSAIDQCLNRDKRWIRYYNEFMQDAEADECKEDTSDLVLVAESEAEYGLCLWNRDYDKAAKALMRTLDTAMTISKSTGAWHMLWLGRALELSGDKDSACEFYQRAHGAERNIPAFPSDADERNITNAPIQVIEVDRQLRIASNQKICLPKNFDTDLACLNNPTSSPKQIEESLRCLGQYLGLKASRPDNEFGAGPDVLWECPDLPALCMEVKTDKETGSLYQKKEVGQLFDHIQWVIDNSPSQEIIPIFVGPVAGATRSANPSESFMVAGIDQFQLLADRLGQALRDVVSNSLSLTLRPTIFKLFKERNLLWPECLKKIKHSRLKEL